MSALAPTLQAFFTHRLLAQRDASPHTITAYRDTFRLLLVFAEHHTGTAPSDLDVADLDASLISAFLTHLECDRNNSARTRNTRLAAIHSLFTFAALRHPEHAGVIQQVLAIPNKRFDKATITFLTRDEVHALLAVPDRSTRLGRRDHALLLVAVQAGLRVSELTRLRRRDVQLGAGAHVRIHGKGRKERCIPLTVHAVGVLQDWMDHQPATVDDPLLPGPHGALGRDAVRRLVAKHALAAEQQCPSLRGKRVTPHVLRHTTAMQLLAAGVI